MWYVLTCLVLGMGWFSATFSCLLIIKLPDKASSSSIWRGKLSKGAFAGGSSTTFFNGRTWFWGGHLDFLRYSYKRRCLLFEEYWELLKLKPPACWQAGRQLSLLLSAAGEGRKKKGIDKHFANLNWFLICLFSEVLDFSFSSTSLKRWSFCPASWIAFCQY